MTHIRRISVYPVLVLLLTVITSFSSKSVFTETKFRSQNLVILLNGTSTLHDWEMKSDKGRCEVSLGLGTGDKLTSLSALNFSIEAESLKSGTGMMDKNAYKALKTGSAKNVNFTFSSASVTQLKATTYQIKVLGKLTIAGTTRETDLLANAQYNPADKSFTISGTKKMKMTEYNVKPPSFMLGTVKTGDEISISFTTKIIR